MSHDVRTIVHDRFILKPYFYGTPTDEYVTKYKLLVELLLAYVRGLEAANAPESQIMVIMGNRLGWNSNSEMPCVYVKLMYGDLFGHLALIGERALELHFSTSSEFHPTIDRKWSVENADEVAASVRKSINDFIDSELRK